MKEDFVNALSNAVEYSQELSHDVVRGSISGKEALELAKLRLIEEAAGDMTIGALKKVIREYERIEGRDDFFSPILRQVLNKKKKRWRLR